MATTKAAVPKPIKETLNRTTLVADIVEQTGQAAKDVKATLAALESSIVRSLNKNGAGVFVLPGLLKIVTVKMPAKPKRKGINPFTGIEQVFAAKPASVKLKVRPLKKLKDAAV